MAYKSKKKGGGHVNTQVSTTANEVFKLLRERYGTGNIPDAIDNFIQDCDEDLYNKAKRRVNEVEEIKTSGKRDRKE